MISYLKKYLAGRREILGINGRNLMGIYPHNQRPNFPNVDDKILCKELLAARGIPVPKTYHVANGKRSLTSWPEKLAGVDRFVIKPNRSFGGNGIILVRRDGESYRSGDNSLTREDIDFHLMQIISGAYTRDNIADEAFFEQTIDSTGLLADLIPPDVEGIFDIRMIYRHDHLLMAMLRLPTKESGGRANLHQGGIGLGIDPAAGTTRSGSYKNRVINHHPETGAPLAGRLVPYFEDLLQIGKRVNGIVGLGYTGIDFVIDRIAGPMILEVNARPGLAIQIANQAGLRRGLE